MDIKIDDFALTCQLDSLYNELDRAADIVFQMDNIADLLHNTSPTKSNIAVAGSMIKSLELIFFRK